MAESVAPSGVEAIDIGLLAGLMDDFFDKVHVGPDIHRKLRIAEGGQVAVEAGRGDDGGAVGKYVIMGRYDDQCFRFLTDDQCRSRFDGLDGGGHFGQFRAAYFGQHDGRMGKESGCCTDVFHRDYLLCCDG